jgi:hypothetical protein
VIDWIPIFKKKTILLHHYVKEARHGIPQLEFTSGKEILAFHLELQGPWKTVVFHIFSTG